jgi:Fe-S cluster biogenesis protein NfuA
MTKSSGWAVGDAGMKEKVEKVLAEEVLPLLGMDGAGVEVVAVEGGVVRVRFVGACGGCPGSVQAVVFGIEEELRKRVPGVEYLEAVP